MAGVDCYATNLDAAEMVAETLGCELVRDATSFKWYGTWVGGGDPRLREWAGTCQHKIRVKGQPDAYEIGLIPRTDGEPGFELIYDNWLGGQGLEAKVGAGLVKFKNGLLDHMAMQQLQSEGYDVRREVDPQTGDILIVAEN
jgi:hypothetical protein